MREGKKGAKYVFETQSRSYGGLPSFDLLCSPLFQTGETGLVGEGRLEEFAYALVKSMEAS